MKILLVHPGALVSTADVYNGLYKALKADGHELVTYRTDSYLITSGHYLDIAVEHAKNKGMEVPTPTQADVFYHASVQILERALRFLPDMVLIVSGTHIHPDAVVMLRRAGIKVAAILTESPYQDEGQKKLIKYLNWAYVTELYSVNELKSFLPNGEVYYLPHAYDPEVHYPIVHITEPPQYTHDVVFVGSGFEDRVSLLEGVNWEGINLGIYGYWETVEPSSPIFKYIKGGSMDNAEANNLYRHSKIGLNIYRKNEYYDDKKRVEFNAYSMNPRVLELAASGVFILSDERPEQHNVFNSAIPSFDTSAELEQLVRYYLRCNDDRVAIAERLPALVQGRTFQAMAQRIVETSTRHVYE